MGAELVASVASVPIYDSQCSFEKWRLPPPGASPLRRKPATALRTTNAPLPPCSTVNASWLVTNQMRPFPPDSTTARDARASVCSSRAGKDLTDPSPTGKFRFPDLKGGKATTTRAGFHAAILALAKWRAATEAGESGASARGAKGGQRCVKSCRAGAAEMIQ